MENMCDLNGKEPIIEYPNFWEYKIIIEKDRNAKQIAKSVVKERKHKVVFSKHSKDGKYASYNLSIMVNSNEERLEIFSALKHICKFVL